MGVEPTTGKPAPDFESRSTPPEGEAKQDVTESAGEMGTDWRPLPNESKAPEDADLRRVVNSWPTLPEAIRAGIMAMVNAAGTR